MSDTTEAKTPINKGNRLTLWMIILVFALPPVAAYFMYYTGIMPEARMNKGTLIEPRALPDISLKTIDGKPYRMGSGTGKWMMAMLTGVSCDDACKRNIYLMRQVRTSLGKDRDHTGRLLIMNDAALTTEMTGFLQEYANMPVVYGTTADSRAVHEYFASVVAGDPSNKLFIIDPRGQVMMHYNQELDPKDLLGDMKRLILVNSSELAGNIN